MHPVIYDVAVSMDGFIAGPNGDISKFAHAGAVVDDYFARLSDYACAVMGRQTYEFGYRFGLEPGKNPYPGLETIVFSETIGLPDDRDVSVVRGPALPEIDRLRTRSNGPVYLCGGGSFAGALLAAGRIDILRLKRAPIVLGRGTPLFGGSPAVCDLQCMATKQYDGGYLFQEFAVSTPVSP